ncbi:MULTISPECIES: hypothetical protein [unclassified Mesorhizobium]|nr:MULTISPECIES: hypothetical protein [unclassified Mesorhizobium]
MSPRGVRANKGYRLASDIAEGAADTAYGMALPNSNSILTE